MTGMENEGMDTMILPEEPDYLAPDGSEIRLLPTTPRGGLAHCRLPPGGVSKPVRHKIDEEVWYCVAGRGELWRRYGQTKHITELTAGVSCKIPFQAAFQFRNAGEDELVIVLSTFPGWPGPEEAVEGEQGKWPTADIS